MSRDVSLRKETAQNVCRADVARERLHVSFGSSTLVLLSSISVSSIWASHPVDGVVAMNEAEIDNTL